MSSPDSPDSRPSSIDPARSTAILVGTSAYTGGLTSFAAADNSLRRMRALLTERCGWLPERVYVFQNMTSEYPVLRDVARLIHEASDAVLFYYVGHGQLIRGRQDLGLALSDTSTDRMLRRSTSLLLSDVKKELEDSDCRIRLMMLDCCYSGLAVSNAQGMPELAEEIQQLSQVEGVYTLTACRFNEQAHYQQGDSGLTYFTKFLAEIVEEGIPGAGRWLTGNAIYRALARRYGDLRDPSIPDLPRPDVLVQGGAGAFGFARNPAWTPPKPVAARRDGSGHDMELAREWVEHDRFIAARLRVIDAIGGASRWPIWMERSEHESWQMSVTVANDPYLPLGQREFNALVTVTRPVADRVTRAPSLVFIVDCTDPRPAVLQVVKDALKTAVGALPEGCDFAVVAGREISELVYPGDGSMAVARADTRMAAYAAIDALEGGGERDLGLWLTRTARLFLANPGGIRSALLLTSGTDGGKHPAAIQDAIRACAGIFTCDCRGVGTDWAVAELRAIAEVLLGTVDVVADPSGLVAELTRWVDQKAGQDLADVALRLRTPQTATVRFVRQVAPTFADLSDARATADAQQGDYPTGAWGPGESRDYHICIDVPLAPYEGLERLAGRVYMIISEGAQALSLGEGLIRVVSGDGPTLPELDDDEGERKMSRRRDSAP